MKIAIVDDKQFWMDQLEQVLRECGIAEENISKHSSGQALLQEIGDGAVDIVFLDIYLGEEPDGMEVAHRLREAGYQNEIVFVTSHDDFALVQKGYEVKAAYYLVKPTVRADVEALLARIDNDMVFRYTVGKDHYAIPHKNILYFESKRNYIQITCTTPEQTTEKIRGKLTALKEQLPQTFVQSHRSYIVNITKVTKLKDNRLYFQNEEYLPMGEKFIKDVLDAFYRWK